MPFASLMDKKLRERLSRRLHGVIVGSLMCALGSYALLRTLGLI